IESVVASTAVVPVAPPKTRRCAISARPPTTANTIVSSRLPPSVATPTTSSSTKLKSTTTALRTPIFASGPATNIMNTRMTSKYVSRYSQARARTHTGHAAGFIECSRAVGGCATLFDGAAVPRGDAARPHGRPGAWRWQRRLCVELSLGVSHRVLWHLKDHPRVHLPPSTIEGQGCVRDVPAQSRHGA